MLEMKGGLWPQVEWLALLLLLERGRQVVW